MACTYQIDTDKGNEGEFRCESERNTDVDSGHVKLKWKQDVQPAVYSF